MVTPLDESGTAAAPPTSRRAPRPGPRGRPVTAEARAAVTATLDGMELRRDLLIEHLHALQDRHGCLREAHLLALAELHRLAPVEVFEVATFYAHFDVMEDAAPPPPPVTASAMRAGVAASTRSRPTEQAGARWQAPMQGAATTRAFPGGAAHSVCRSWADPAIAQGRLSQTRTVTGGGGGAASSITSKCA